MICKKNNVFFFNYFAILHSNIILKIELSFFFLLRICIFLYILIFSKSLKYTLYF